MTPAVEMPEPTLPARVPIAWFKSDDARKLIEWAFAQWADDLTVRERESYDGFVGFLLAVLADEGNYQ